MSNALSGDNNAIDKIIEAYSDCINKYCMSYEVNNDGDIKIICNEDLKRYMIKELKVAIPNFKL